MPTFPSRRAAIAFAKLLNAGQTCVAPDYMLVPRSRVDAFVAAMRKAVAAMYPTVCRQSRLHEHRERTALPAARASCRRRDRRAARRRFRWSTPRTASRGARKFPPTLLVGADDAHGGDAGRDLRPGAPDRRLRLARRGDRVREPPSAPARALLVRREPRASRPRAAADDFRRRHDQRRMLAREPGVPAVRRRRRERHGRLSRRARLP